MNFVDFATVVQRIVASEYPSVPPGALLTVFPDDPRVTGLYVEWTAPHVTLRLTDAGGGIAMLHVVAEGVSIMPVTYSMSDADARNVAISVSAMFDSPVSGKSE